MRIRAACLSLVTLAACGAAGEEDTTSETQDEVHGLNRARRVVYETISRLRHDLNGVDRVEPKDLSLPGE